MAEPKTAADFEATAPRVEAVLKELHELGAKVFFEKPLTQSDTHGTGRVVIPKAIAEQFFPTLEEVNGLPVHAVDTRGKGYTFKWRYWVNNQSRMYLIEGAVELHRAYGLQVGDVMMFAQKPDLTLVVAGRPALPSDVVRKAPARVKNVDGEGSSKNKNKSPRGEGSGRGRGGKRAKSNSGMPFVVDVPADGIFRALTSNPPEPPVLGVSQSRTGRWLVTMDLAGELYQAVFDLESDALEAFNAAGGVYAAAPQAPVLPPSLLNMQDLSALTALAQVPQPAVPMMAPVTMPEGASLFVAAPATEQVPQYVPAPVPSAEAALEAVPVVSVPADVLAAPAEDFASLQPQQ